MSGLFLLRLTIEGIYPEGALARFRRAGIPVSDVKKRDKKTLELCIERKYREKAFTTLRDSCYNITGTSLFGVWRLFAALRRKIGFFIGAALFILLAALSDLFVLRIDVVGTGAYYRDRVLSVLRENGVRPGGLYRAEKVSAIAAEVLSFDGVSFCSLKKEGSVLTVEVQVDRSLPPAAAGGLYAPADGTVYSLTVLRGEAHAEEGDEVARGSLLVGAAEGQSVVMASARLLCRYESLSSASTAEEAVAEGVLAALSAGEAEIVSQNAEPQADGYLVEIEYLLTVAVNMD